MWNRYKSKDHVLPEKNIWCNKKKKLNPQIQPFPVPKPDTKKTLNKFSSVLYLSYATLVTYVLGFGKQIKSLSSKQPKLNFWKELDSKS